MEIRWLATDEIERLVNPDLEARGWAVLNLNESQPTCRVLGAFMDGVLIESFTFQLYPMLGPLLKHQDVRDSGETSRKLASTMEDFLNTANARDFLAVANSPVTERLCKRFGMNKLDIPVYCKKTGSQDDTITP